jgi:hypothetical protein
VYGIKDSYLAVASQYSVVYTIVGKLFQPTWLLDESVVGFEDPSSDAVILTVLEGTFTQYSEVWSTIKVAL